jgi:hypothetical protein
MELTHTRHYGEEKGLCHETFQLGHTWTTFSSLPAGHHYEKLLFSLRIRTYRKLARTIRIIVPVSEPTGKFRWDKNDREIQFALMVG